RRREISYWVAVLFIFALGTALVDLVTLEWHVSALLAAVIFLALILMVGALFTRFRAAAVLLFWVAYVLTRPLAGALSDWLPDGVGLGARTLTPPAGSAPSDQFPSALLVGPESSGGRERRGVDDLGRALILSRSMKFG